MFFAVFLFPILKGMYHYVRGETEDIKKKRDEKLSSLTKEKRLIATSLRTSVYVIPYYGAYIYAEHAYLWLTLAIIYTIVIVINILIAVLMQLYRNNNPEEYSEMEKQSKRDLKNVIFWPKWQVHALCAFNVSILALWLYSWRYIFA